MKKINLVSAYQAAGDQPVAIETLIDGINNKAETPNFAWSYWVWKNIYYG